MIAPNSDLSFPRGLPVSWSPLGALKVKDTFRMHLAHKHRMQLPKGKLEAINTSMASGDGHWAG